MKNIDFTLHHTPETGPEAMIRLADEALAAGAMASDREACLAAGMDGHLPKPLKRSVLESVLREIGYRTAPTTH